MKGKIQATSNKRRKTMKIRKRPNHSTFFLFLALTLQPITIASSSSSQSYQKSYHNYAGTETNVHKSNTADSDRYSSFPPIVFSPEGRLYKVEQNAQAASDRNDLSASLVVALKFGSVEDEAVMVFSTCSKTPLLYNPLTDEEETDADKEKNDTSDEAEEGEDKESQIIKRHIPLWKHDVHPFSNEDKPQMTQERFLPSMPLSLLSNNLLIGTGGNAVDSRVLMERIQKLALSMLSQDGACMQGNYRIRGQVWSGSLARKVADMLQVPTQNVGEGSIGRMLASSAVIIGGNEVRSFGGDAKQVIWRVDSTGQFWECEAAAVGRGSGIAEGSILKHVLKWKTSKAIEGNLRDEEKAEERQPELDDLILQVTNDDVKQCLVACPFDDAVVLGCQSIIQALGLKKSDSTMDQIGLQGVLIRKSKRGLNKNVELIHTSILREGLKVAFDKQ